MGLSSHAPLGVTGGGHMTAVSASSCFHWNRLSLDSWTRPSIREPSWHLVLVVPRGPPKYYLLRNKERQRGRRLLYASPGMTGGLVLLPRVAMFIPALVVEEITGSQPVFLLWKDSMGLLAHCELWAGRWYDL